MPYKFNMLRDTMNMGGDSEEQAEKQAERERIVAEGDPIAIKRQAIADQDEYLNSADFKSKSFLEKMLNPPKQTIAQEADFKNTAGAVMGSVQGIPSAGIGSGLRSLKGVIPSTAGKTALQAEARAAQVLKEPGMAKGIHDAAMQSSVFKMLPKKVANVLPDDMSLLDRIQYAKLMSNIKTIGKK